MLTEERDKRIMHRIVCEDLEAILAAEVDWNSLKGKSVLITGANGFLPAYMIESILMLNARHDLNCKITGCVRDIQKACKRFYDYRHRSDLCFIELDVSKEINISGRFDYIIHAASPASPKLFGIDPVGTMLANLHGTNQLLMLANEWGSERFLFLSTGEVYGDVSPEKIPTSESDYGYIDILNVRSCYCESKRAAETLIVSYFKQYGVPSVIVRPFHTYGPGMNLDDGRVFADFVNSAVKGSDIILASDGAAVRAFCYLSDAVSGFFTALFNGKTGEAYNVGNPFGAISIKHLAEMVAGLRKELSLKVRTSTRDADDVYIPSPIKTNSPDISAISKLGWKPTVMPEAGFGRTIKYYTDV